MMGDISEPPTDWEAAQRSGEGWAFAKTVGNRFRGEPSSDPENCHPVSVA